MKSYAPGQYPLAVTLYADDWARLLARVLAELQINDQLLTGPIQSQLYVPLATWFTSIGGPDEPLARATLESTLLRLLSRTKLGLGLRATLNVTHARILDLRRSSSYKTVIVTTRRHYRAALGLAQVNALATLLAFK
jgi:hypothetical protein